MKAVAICVLAMFTALLLTVVLTFLGRTAHAEGVYTAEDVEGWIEAYSVEYATPAAPYEWLVLRSTQVAFCETGGFNPAVINNARRGRSGEVGSFQFLPGPGSIFWATPSAEAGWDYWDPEANVAGAVWLIAQGYGPRHWSCW